MALLTEMDKSSGALSRFHPYRLALAILSLVLPKRCFQRHANDKLQKVRVIMLQVAGKGMAG